MSFYFKMLLAINFKGLKLAVHHYRLLKITSIAISRRHYWVLAYIWLGYGGVIVRFWCGLKVI